MNISITYTEKPIVSDAGNGNFTATCPPEANVITPSDTASISLAQTINLTHVANLVVDQSRDFTLSPSTMASSTGNGAGVSVTKHVPTVIYLKEDTISEVLPKIAAYPGTIKKVVEDNSSKIEIKLNAPYKILVKDADGNSLETDSIQINLKKDGSQLLRQSSPAILFSFDGEGSVGLKDVFNTLEPNEPMDFQEALAAGISRNY